MLNNWQSIAQKNRSELLDSPETYSVHYNYNHMWIESVSKQYRVYVLYPKIRLTYSRHTRSIQMTVSSLRHEVQAHLKSTLLSRLTVADLTPHPDSIHWPVLSSRYSLLTSDPTPGYGPTPGKPLNCVYPLRITLERFILLHSKHIFSFLNLLNLWPPAHTECHLSHPKLFGAGAVHPAGPKLISESMLDQYVKATS
jgi:hypothetical protein